MVDVDTFLIILYVMVDDFFASRVIPRTTGRPEPERGSDLSPVRAVAGLWQ
jgi:hypothetical protein